MTIIPFLFLLFFPSEQSGKKISTEIIPIPRTSVNLDGVDENPFPRKQPVLSLNTTGSHRGRIGSIALNEKYIFVSYPDNHLVIRYAFGKEETLLIGPQIHGGNGIPLDSPGHLTWQDDSLFIASQVNGKVYIIKETGELINFDELPDVRNPLPAPKFPVGKPDAKRRYLIIDPHQANLLLRCDNKGKPIVRYGLGQSPKTREVDPMDWNLRGMAQVLPDWSMAFVSFSGATVMYLNPKGQIMERYILSSSTWKDPSPVVLRPGWEHQPMPEDPIKAVQYSHDSFWILLEQDHDCLLLEIYKKTYKLFKLSVFWDGFSIQAGKITFFNRKTGQVSVYRWP